MLKRFSLHFYQGFLDYCKRYGNGIYDVSMSFGPVPRLGGSTAQEVALDLESHIPINRLDGRRKWRDDMLQALASIKSEKNK